MEHPAADKAPQNQSNVSFSQSDDGADARVSEALEARLFETRQHSLNLAEPLSAEDMVVQASDDASPTKWHLAHVTWFFENFVLRPHLADYRVFDDKFNYCFNSYYETLGPRHPRPKRGMLTRPTSERVFAYRQHVDEGLRRLLARDDFDRDEISLPSKSASITSNNIKNCCSPIFLRSLHQIRCAPPIRRSPSGSTSPKQCR